MTDQSQPQQPPVDDGFEKLEPANLVVIGDGPKQSKRFGGLLMDIVDDDVYPEKKRYIVIGRDGKDYEIAGNAALSKRLKRSHIGCLMKVEFKGRERGATNEYKVIEVVVQPRDRTTEAQKETFPAWHNFTPAKAEPTSAGGPTPTPEGPPPPTEPASDPTAF